MQPLDLDDRMLGATSGLLVPRDRDQCQRIIAHLAGQARRELCLLSRDLDRALYDQAPFLDALRELALRGAQSRIRILLQDPAGVARQGHRILELARRLTSRIELRRPAEEWLNHPENFLLADSGGYVHWELWNRYEASADYQAPLQVRRLRAQFDAIWDTGEPDPELRRLHL